MSIFIENEVISASEKAEEKMTPYSLRFANYKA